MDVNMFYGKKFENIAAAFDYADSNNHTNFDFTIIPPNADRETDEEEIDEGNLLRNDFPHDIPGELELLEVSDSEDDVPLSELRKSMLEPSAIKWRKRPMNMDMPSSRFFETSKSNMNTALEDKSPVEVFETIVDRDVVQLIVDQTMKYASQHNMHRFSITAEELKVFIGILLFSGYHSLPRERMYWQLDEDTHLPLISNNMSRNRFQEIKRYIHLADNSKLDLSDKMAKIRPLSKMLCEKFCQFGYMHKNLSIDESMVKYFGGHSAKQFIRGKPVRFGFKNWMLTSSCGYLYQMDTYCGAKVVDRESQHLPLGSRVVLDFVKSIPHPTDHIMFFDNFFTSFDILSLLKQKGFKATGTVRDRRTKNCPLVLKKAMQKEERGKFDYR